jgi:hypothetical protein
MLLLPMPVSKGSAFAFAQPLAQSRAFSTLPAASASSFK